MPETNPYEPPRALDMAEKRAEVRGRVLLVIVATIFLDMVGFGIILPLLPLYVTEMHASVQTVGFIFTSFAVAQLFATPVLGGLSDRYGRKPIIVISLIGSAVSMIVFAAATRYAAIGLLFFSRILAGATAGNLSACQAAIADVTDKRDRAGAMGRIGAGIGLGMAVGPFLGGELARISPSAPPLGACVMALIDLVLALVLMPETRGLAAAQDAPKGPKPKLATVLTDRKMLSVIALFFLTFLAMTNNQVSLGLLTQERFGWGAEDIGRVFGIFGVIGFVVQGLLVGKLAKTFGEIHLVIAGAALNTAGMLLIGLSQSSAAVVGGLVVFGLGVSFTNPVISTLASRLARPDQQGSVLGVVQSSGTLARAIGPTWSGVLFQHLGSKAPFTGGAIATAVAFLIAVSLRAEAVAPQSEPGAPASGGSVGE